MVLDSVKTDYCIVMKDKSYVRCKRDSTEYELVYDPRLATKWKGYMAACMWVDIQRGQGFAVVRAQETLTVLDKMKGEV